jgi:predicted RecB family nuclease
MHVSPNALLLSPTDITHYLACPHLTTLELQAARGGLERPERTEDADLLTKKGEAHEAAYLERLRSEGRDVREIEVERDADGFEAAAAATRRAIEDGVDVIYQGVFVDGRWRGQADFLERTEDGSYEALDTKLAQRAKPHYILQLCFYSEALGKVQDKEPELMHVLLGSGEKQSFRPRDFDAYARRVRRRLEEFVATEPHTEPVPVSHCRICDFLPRCEAWWDEVDHLSLVAGMRRQQIERLKPAGIGTLRELARADPASPPPGMNPELFASLQRQAALQLVRREEDRLEWLLLPPEAERGLALLPAPSVGDLFFDIEGNPFWDEQGSLEYLWGFVDADRRYTALWAEDHESERRAFEELVDRIHARLMQFPDMHVYHYASYEVTVLRRLAGRYESREHEVDELLRRQVLVDLLKVVRKGVAASVPRYGLKDMEAFLEFERTAEIRDGGSSVVEYQRYVETGDRSILDEIAHYNKEDCVATLKLRDWLLERRAEALEEFGDFPLPEPKEATPLKEEKESRARLRDELAESGEEALELAAGLLHYHEREGRPVWWAYFDRLQMTPEELLEDAESISGLEALGEPVADAKSTLCEFTYPPQEHKLGAGASPFDPATKERAGKIVALDREARKLMLRRGPSLDGVPSPRALLPEGPYFTTDQQRALERIGRSLLARDQRYPAVESILRREPFARDVQTTDIDEMVALLLSLDGRHLVIQGPPGSGKTYTSGRLIARALEAGRRVGVASTSHRAIHKLLREVEEAGEEHGIEIEGVKKASAGNPESFYREGEKIENSEERAGCVGVELSGGTAWLYAHEDCDSSLDYLFIDEAGQVSLADALAMASAARNVVLVGDPQQLAQVIQGTHPDGVDVSVLQHLLGEHATVPPNAGLFLEETYRLHPDIARYISREFYEERLRAAPMCAERTTPLGTGVRFCPVEHEGCRQESPAEAQRVARELERMREAGIGDEEIIVLAPYNAHVNLLREHLPEAVRVGTVDKFQGQEALVAIYSMASSSGAEVPRGLEFLLSRNRLNVAISRAQCLAYLVCSPRLLEVDCRTIDQMRLANALCRLAEMAKLVDD